MFRQFSDVSYPLTFDEPPPKRVPPSIEPVDLMFKYHPFELTALLEIAWDMRDPGPPDSMGGVSSTSSFWGGSGQGDRGSLHWDHLIYAFMLENTGVYEIFRRVIHEYVTGERLGVPSAQTQGWLRTTEELFYRDPVPMSITSVTSSIRPDLRATRRNAYHRMFGLDLNQGNGGSSQYPAVPYARAEAANGQFQEVFEEFLKEAWAAIENASNTSGSNPTDPAKLGTLADNLQSMLLARRLNGNLAREEFAAVSTMQWFHLSLLNNNALITDLGATATSPEQRLLKIGQKVGLPAHALSYNYVNIADPISRLLLLIERYGRAVVPAVVGAGPVQQTLRTIITHWSAIRGINVKTKSQPVELVRLAPAAALR